MKRYLVEMLTCACNIHVTGDSMHVVTLHACSSNVTCAVLLDMHVGYMSHTHVTCTLKINVCTCM